ncbi:hypothetical protein TNCV_646291 [Trichonephila clavipes]|nr:hypothetical protein TNCV_646291 [Trichonephila clavipes]
MQNHGQVTWTTSELTTPSPNYHITPTGERFSSRRIYLVENALEKSKQEAEKNEREAEIQLEKIKLSQIEKQLELEKVRKESEKNPQTLESGEPSSITDKLESLVKSIKTLTG